MSIWDDVNLPIEMPPTSENVGRGSWYSQAPGWVDLQDRPRSNALGVPDEMQGIALPSRETLGQYFDVTFPGGQTHRLQQTDVGPAAWTGRGIDISAAAASRIYGSPHVFPTDAQFSWRPAGAMQPFQVAQREDNIWTRSAAGAAVAPAPEPAKGGSIWDRTLGLEPQAPAPTEAPSPAAKPSEPSDHIAFTRGLVTGVMKENPEAYADFLEGQSYNAPEILQRPMRSGAEKLRSMVKDIAPEGYERQINSMWDVKGVGDAFTWAGEALGQAAASTLPSAVLGGVGAAAGALTPVPGGAMIGAGLGATAGSYPLNYADLYGDLKKEGMSPEEANKWASVAAVPITALDVGSEAFALLRFGGAAAAKRELTRGVARRIAVEAAKTGGVEASTEAAQQIIQEATTSLATERPLLTTETAKRVTESGVVGGMFGGIVGAPSGLRAEGGARAPAAQTSEQSVAELTAPAVALPGEKEPGPVGPEAALETTKTDVAQPPGLPEPQAQSYVVPPEGGRIFAEEVQAPAPVFYSALYRAAKEKLPESGSASQMLATLKRQHGVKLAEIDDTGVGNFLQSLPGKVTKQQVLEHLEENGIKIEEVFSTRGDTIQPFGEMLRGGTRYDYALAPGPVQSYTELRMVIPPKPGQEVFIDSHWPDNPNTFAHAQITTRIDKAGRLVAHVEGVQSTWMQTGRLYGFMSEADATRAKALLKRVGELDRLPRAARTEQLVQERMELMREVRGLRYREIAEDTYVRKPPSPPFTGDWASLVAKRLYRWAADNGYSTISWANPELAIAWNTGRHGNVAAVSDRAKSGLKEFYGKIFPSRMKEIARKFGGVLGASEIDVTPSGLAALYTWRTVRKVWNAAPRYEIVDPSGQVVGDTFDRRRAIRVTENFNKQPPPAQSVRVENVTIPEAGRTLIQRGVPMYDHKLEPTGPRADLKVDPNVDQAIRGPFRTAANKVIDGFNEIAKKLGLDAKIDVRLVGSVATVGGQVFRGADQRGLMWQRPDGKYEIVMFLTEFRYNIAAFYATLMHEFGHVVVFEKFNALPDNVKLLILQEYKEWRDAAKASGRIEKMLPTKRPAALWWLMNMVGSQEFTSGAISSLGARQQQYHLGSLPDVPESGFHEYMADQVARWATTTAEPLSIVEKAWSGISKALRFFQEWMASKFGVETRPTLTIQNWLNSFLTQAAPMGEQEYQRLDLRTQKANQYYVQQDSGDPGVGMPPTQPPVAAIDNQINDANGGNPPVEAKVASAHASRISWIYEYFGSILDLAQRNPNFTPLLRYIEKARDKDREEKKIHDAALQVAKSWRGLGRNQEEKVANFLDELTNMTYLSDQEKARGVERHPTADEVIALARRLGVEPAGLDVAARVRRFTEKMLDLVSDLARVEAMKINDPIVRANKIDEINQTVFNMKKKPYFPFMRFGRYYVLVRTKGGATRYFETFERKGLTSAQTQQARKATEMRRLHPDDEVIEDVLPKTAEPFFGLPPNMLDLIKQKLNLTPAQLDALNQLKFQLSPAMSFQHHFQHKRYVPGYSRDFLRAFSRYAFHGGRYYAKTLYVDGMRQDIRDAQAVRTNLSGRIADFMRDHLQNAILDVKGDYGTLKGLMFLWAMGYSPAAATLNMTQIPMITFPFLAAQFGNVRASRTLAATMFRLSNFYKRGTYEGLKDWELRGLGYGIRTGRIVETQAPMIAAMSQGGIFKFSSGGDMLQRGANQIMEKSSIFFEGAEQWNRRITFRAAMKLAFENPDAKIVQEAMNRYPGEYQELRQKWGHSDLEARAIVTAGHVTDRTQFVYAGWARPRFMRGRLAGSIFIFKRYLQSLLFLIGSDNKFMMRYLLMAAMMGGLGGIPGAEDLKNIIQAMLRFLGYNADVEKQIRTYIKDYTGDAVPGDMVLHGLARRGFGIPAALDALGSLFTGRPGRGLLSDPRFGGVNVPYPQLDRSRAVTPGPVIPEAVWQILDPSKQVGEALGGGTTQALGYGFSAMVNMLKAITDNHLHWTDLKRWEKAEPRALASLSKMYRALTERDPDRTEAGQPWPYPTRERSGGPMAGTTVTRYDIRDTEQLMEVIALGLGYNDLRRANEWDRIIHQNEHTKYVDIQRKGLMEQFNEARRSSPQEADAIRKKIQEFNAGLSPEDRGKAITGESLQRSVTARERERRARELNRPVQRGNVPIAQEYERVYPRTIELLRR